jgi:hypothetical protein
MGSVHARGDTFLTFGLKALTETNTSRLATGTDGHRFLEVGLDWVRLAHAQMVMNSGVINTPPHDFRQPSRWYY